MVISIVCKALLPPKLRTSAEDTDTKFNTFLTCSELNGFLQNTQTWNLNTLLRYSGTYILTYLLTYSMEQSPS